MGIVKPKTSLKKENAEDSLVTSMISLFSRGALHPSPWGDRVEFTMKVNSDATWRDPPLRAFLSFVE
jgi:hypothetical protein